CFLILSATSACASSVDIHILGDQKATAIVISVTSGKYLLAADGKRIGDTLSAAIIEFRLKGDSIVSKTMEINLGTFKNITLRAVTPGSGFRMKCLAPLLGLRLYDDDLNISIEKDQFFLINHVDFEKYVAGVVEAESGTVAKDEFYKVQSILCRTYALANLNKHSAEGFNLCDQVHCQVFRGHAKDKRIYAAAHSTKDLIAVDNDLKLISTTFCSNCGGQTVNSEDVWGKSSTCLKSVIDSFCIRMPHARWERHISSEDWKNYLQLKHRFPVNDTVAVKSAMNCSPNGRSVYFNDNGLKIPLKVIRADFQLKSTYFSVEEKNDSVIFRGKGYGHGVGLCQEGAMNMARLGYSYRDILNFYYRNINIIDLDKMEFFKEEEQ
ncbi:MAG TPA: SpoIID/LytB domain-containing protein, partial [Bacteroidia bacterium]|nr:SpoIID/LytB domain-containing protein [Bacteroidia bacterium]